METKTMPHETHVTTNPPSTVHVKIHNSLGFPIKDVDLLHCWKEGRFSERLQVKRIGNEDTVLIGDAHSGRGGFDDWIMLFTADDPKGEFVGVTKLVVAQIYVRNEGGYYEFHIKPDHDVDILIPITDKTANLPPNADNVKTTWERAENYFYLAK